MSEKNTVASEIKPEENLNEILKVRRKKLEDLKSQGKDPFVTTKYDVTNHSSDIKNNFDLFEGKEVSVAGRLMSKRVMGKASFCHVQDLKGYIQAYVARDNVGADEYAGFKLLDIGDIIGIKELFLKQKPARFQYMQPKFPFFQKACSRCLKNFTDLQIPTCAIVSVMLT